MTEGRKKDKGNSRGAPGPIKDVDESVRNITREGDPILSSVQKKVYRDALKALNASGVRYAVGAAFARHAYTSIWRPTKDLDVFVMHQDLKTALQHLEEAGFRTEIVIDHWLAKAWKDDYFIDLIFGTGHGHLPIDEQSFEGSRKAEIVGVQTQLIPIEEMIASAAYIATRGRFDGGEIVHLIRKTRGKLDWQRILERLGDNRQLLLWHLILFDFVYPGHHNYLPKDLIDQLYNEMCERWEGSHPRRVFRGTLLDPFSYNVDITDWGYKDPRRLEPLVDEEGEAL